MMITFIILKSILLQDSLIPYLHSFPPISVTIPHSPSGFCPLNAKVTQVSSLYLFCSPICLLFLHDVSQSWTIIFILQHFKYSSLAQATLTFYIIYLMASQHLYLDIYWAIWLGKTESLHEPFSFPFTTLVFNTTNVSQNIESSSIPFLSPEV